MKCPPDSGECPSASQGLSSTIEHVNDCPECGYPMVWSDDARSQRCAVYGTHEQAARHRIHPLVRDMSRPVDRHLRAVS